MILIEIECGTGYMWNEVERLHIMEFTSMACENKNTPVSFQANYGCIIFGNKMPTRCNRFFLQTLLLAQHVSGTTMPIIRSSRVLYSGCCLWYFVL